MAITARRTDESSMPLDQGWSPDGRRRVRWWRYAIVDRYGGRDTLVGHAWGTSARAALHEWRRERLGKTDA